MSNTTALVMSRRAIAEAVGADAAVLVGRIDHAEMVHGAHWKWAGEQVFTEEGVELLVDRLAELDGGASLALRAAARAVFAPATLAGVSRPAEPVRDRANGYQAEVEEGVES